MEDNSVSDENSCDNIDDKLQLNGDRGTVNSDVVDKFEAKEVESEYALLSECKSVIKSDTKNKPESSIPAKPVIEPRNKDTSQSSNLESVSNTDKVKVMEGATGQTGDRVDGKGSPVVMRKKSANPDMDVFKGRNTIFYFSILSGETCFFEIILL